MDSKERTLGTRASIFRKTDKVIPELEKPELEKQAPAQQAPVQPVLLQPVLLQPVPLQPVEEIKQPEGEPPKQPRIKATFYLYPDDVLAIDSMQSEEFRHTRKKPERSQIVSRAIQAYKAQLSWPD